MQNPSYDEAIVMVRAKRKAAKEALGSIIEAFGTYSNQPGPVFSLNTLLTYFSNSVYGLELLMKLMSEDWGPDGLQPSKNGHNVGKMYTVIFQRPYAKSDLMQRLQRAILDQKFLYEPDGGLKDRVPELEALWDELEYQYTSSRWGTKYVVCKEIEMGREFSEYLRDNAPRYVSGESYTFTSKEHRVNTLKTHIAILQEKLKALEESTEPTFDELHAMLEQEFTRKVTSLRLVLDDRIKQLNGVFSFAVGEIGGVFARGFST
jgi:hypothetical protein